MSINPGGMAARAPNNALVLTLPASGQGRGVGGLRSGACASFVGAAPCARRGLVPELRSGTAPPHLGLGGLPRQRSTAPAVSQREFRPCRQVQQTPERCESACSTAGRPCGHPRLRLLPHGRKSRVVGGLGVVRHASIRSSHAPVPATALCIQPGSRSPSKFDVDSALVAQTRSWSWRGVASSLRGSRSAAFRRPCSQGAHGSRQAKAPRTRWR